MLPICDPTTKICKVYVVARDRVLRESSEQSSPRFPPFHHVTESRNDDFDHLNVFLVALNAEIKFRRYFAMTQLNPPTVPLPDDVLSIMSRTMELMELLYWRPVPTKGSPGEKIYAEAVAYGRQNPVRGARPDPTGTIERSSREEMDVGEDVQSLRGVAAVRLPWPEDADLETRMAIGRALMSGHGLLRVLSLSLFTHSEFTKTGSMIRNYLKAHTHLVAQTVGPSYSFLSITHCCRPSSTFV